MSMTFVSGRQRREPTQQTVQSLLDENSQLIQAIVDYQSKGKAYECTQYQQLLHRNLVYLATLADSSQSIQNTLSTPSSQTAPTVIKNPPVSVTPPCAGGMLQPGLPDVPTSTVPSADMIPNTSSMTAGMPDPMNSGVPPPSLGGMSNTTAGVYGSGTVSGLGQSTSSPPQLQHPPMTAQSPMGYPNPSQNPTGRPIAPPMANLPPQVPNQAHVPPVGQHMMSQNQQQSQQYLMQQRQIQYRPNTSQQMPPQQQPLSHNPPPYGPPTAGMPSSNMLPPYHTQQQSQRYNLYRPSPQQQGLSHMPYPGQQQAPTMQGPPMMAQQPPMGQSPVSQATMQQPSPLV